MAGAHGQLQSCLALGGPQSGRFTGRGGAARRDLRSFTRSDIFNQKVEWRRGSAQGFASKTEPLVDAGTAVVCLVAGMFSDVLAV